MEAKNIEEYLVGEQTTLKEAMARINTNGFGFVVIVDDQRKLLGVLTDGDIRRALLNGTGMDALIAPFYNTHPAYAVVDGKGEVVFPEGKHQNVKNMPLVDLHRKVVDVILESGSLQYSAKPNSVVIMAGGIGKRLMPLTKETPKPMLKIGAKPILRIIIEKFKQYGFSDFLISVNYKAEQIIDYFGDGSDLGVTIDYIREEKKLGTAGAISLIKRKMEHPFFVVNGDVLTNLNYARMMDQHIRHGAFATMGLREYDIQIPYGVINTDGDQIVSIEEKPTLSYHINGGIYILDPACIPLLRSDEYMDMPDLFQEVIRQERKVFPYIIREYWIDVGRPEDLRRAETENELIMGF